MMQQRRKGLRSLGTVLAVGFMLAVAVPARAATVLLFIDHLLGTDFVTPALTALGHTVTTATDWTDFNNKLAGSPPQLAIALNQNSGLGANLATMTTYVNGGGRVILADWTETATFAALLNASYTGNDNQSPLNFTNPSLSAGITNPQPLSNPGWGRFSMGLSAVAGGSSVCSFPIASCAVVGNSGRTILLGFLSDTPQSGDGVRLWENIINLVLGAGAPAPKTPIPTVEGWTAAALAALMLVVGLIVVRRRA